MLVISNADYADRNGRYKRDSSLKVGWAPLKPVYKHLTKERYVFWRPENKPDPGWAIGPEGGFVSGGSFHVGT